MNKANCPSFERGYSCPLCPLDEVSIEHGIWYPDEEICNRKDFQSLDWIRRQKEIVKAKAPADKYFSVSMLQCLKQVRKGIRGLDADRPLKKANEAERKWIAEKKSNRVIAKQTERGRQVVAKKRHDLALATSTSHQAIGGENDV